MKKRLSLYLLILLCVSCRFQFKENTDRINALNEMQQTDVDFSNRAKDVGIRNALLEFIEPDGVLLRPNILPLGGADAVEWIQRMNDSSGTITWEPIGADMAASADMGYTYGIYSITGTDTTFQGTYITVWRKQTDGKWKFVINSGNK